MTNDHLLTNATIATMEAGGVPYGLIKSGAIGFSAGRITYVGSADSAPDSANSTDLAGALVTPALIDCHTHLVFGGDRIAEFEQRRGGASYEAIAEAGGGILSTVYSTRSASDDALIEAADRRMRWLLESGVGTVEIKSGYGLDREHELRMLQIARRIGAQGGMRVRTSLLAAHTVPPEHRADPDRYVSEIVKEIIPAAAQSGLADAVDAFGERIAFTSVQVRRVFEAAQSAGLPVRLHADQLTDGGGAALAAEYGALSADHLDHASRSGIEAMAESGTVAVVIPGASAFLNEPMSPDIGAMRESGVAIAVSTDLNPGTSPLASLPTAMWLAAARYQMTPEECLAGATRNAAAALGLNDTGVLRVGMRADFAVWDTSSPAALSYWAAAPLCRSVWMTGQVAFERNES